MSFVPESKLIADHSEVLPELAPVPLKKAATLSNLWGTFVEQKNAAPRTVNKLRFIGKKFLAFFREREITVSTLKEWTEHVCAAKNAQGQPVSPQRVHSVNCEVRSFLKFIKKLGFIKHDLWEFVELPRIPDPKMPEILSAEEYESLKACIKNVEKYQWALWMIILGYRTGMSMGDCANLRWEQVILNDASESYMDVPRQKLGKKNVICRIPIVPGSDLHEWLLKLHAQRPFNYKRADGLNYVHQDCPGMYNAMVGVGYMNKDFARIFKWAGVKGKSFASFRRTFISNLVNSGMEYPLICKITGHTNLKTLLGYLRPDRKALQDGVMKAQQYAEEKGTAP